MPQRKALDNSRGLWDKRGVPTIDTTTFNRKAFFDSKKDGVISQCVVGAEIQNSVVQSIHLNVVRHTEADIKAPHSSGMAVSLDEFKALHDAVLEIRQWLDSKGHW